MTAFCPGPRNLITDIAGLKVGNSEDMKLKSGVTVLTGEKPFLAAVHVMGGAPGTRETDLLEPDKMVETIDALVLSGGSAFGLDAASGVADALYDEGRGFPVGAITVPIVPAAILSDLLNGGDKTWTTNPYRTLGKTAYRAAGIDFALGSAGAGTGALAGDLKGGLGSASLVLPNGHIVGALVAVNPFGSANIPDYPHFWAGPYEVGNEFGGLGPCPARLPLAMRTPDKPNPLNSGTNTTIAIVATDAVMTKAETKRLAVTAHDGMARALVPAHTPFDGDLVFAAATGSKPIVDPVADRMLIGHAASLCLARAIARGVHAATAADGDILPTWLQKFGHHA